MPSGRPVSLQTIKNTLKAIASDLPQGSDQDMCAAISVHLGQKNFMTAKTLHQVVVDLDSFATREREFLGAATVAHLHKCIDSLARMELKAMHATEVKPRASKKLSAKAMANRDIDRSIKAATMAATTAHQRRSTEAIIGAIDILLEDVGVGEADNDTFASLRHLINVLERLS